MYFETLFLALIMGLYIMIVSHYKSIILSKTFRVRKLARLHGKVSIQFVKIL